MTVATTALWGEWLLLWLYSTWPLEPYREKARVGQYLAAYDPRRRLYHVLWRAEPTRSEFGIAAAQTLHEMYASLALQPGEYLAVVQIGNERFVRLQPRRRMNLASPTSSLCSAHTSFCNPRRGCPAESSRGAGYMYVAAAPLALTLFNPVFIITGALLLYHARNT
jgi:hypothetical protein